MPLPLSLMLVLCFGLVLFDGNDAVISREKRSLHKLRVVTIENPPYTHFDQGSNGVQYTGFIPDLIHMMSRRLNFDYEFYPSPDGRYGTADESGQWNGMIGELTKRQYGPDGNVTTQSVGADMSAAPLTVTSIREAVIDFVKPFHHLGLTVVVQKAYMKDNSTDAWPIDFSIFRPLAPMVWLVVFIVVIVVGVLLGLMNRFNPYEWDGCYKRGQAQKSESESFNWSGSIWFVFTTLQWQGFERAPRSIASKVLTCFWFAFVTLTLVTYIGSLVNHLWWASMMQRHNPTKHPISDLADLVSGDFRDFRVGCISGGSTYSYVTKVAASKMAEFQQIKRYWETDIGSQQLVTSTAEGIRKVRSEKFAMIMETMSARYHMNQLPCDLTTVGDQFALRSYGLAVPKNSPFLEDFHRVILELQEEGEIDSLEQKWWEGRGECWNVTSMEKTMDKATSLYISQAKPKTIDLNMFWGVVVTMVIGMILAVLAAIGEIVYYKYKGRHDEINRSQIQSLPSRMDQDDRHL